MAILFGTVFHAPVAPDALAGTPSILFQGNTGGTVSLTHIASLEALFPVA